MPLAPCPDCGNECSTLAQYCPKCGRPLEPDDSQNDEPVPFVQASQSRSEREEERAARERKERVASIPVTSRVVTPFSTSTVTSDRNTKIGCVIVAVIFIAFALFCCSGGSGGIGGGMYEECVRQRKAAGLDTSPCSEWTK